MTEHISDDDLERCAMGTVKDERELAFLVCDLCIGRAENTQEYVAVATAPKLPPVLLSPFE